MKNVRHEILSTRSVDRVKNAFDEATVTVVEKKRYDTPELIDIVSDAEGLFVHSENDFDAELIERAPNLRAIAKPGSGIDNIDVDAATDAGVVVLHTPGMNAVAVSEFTVGTILAHYRDVPAAQDHLEAGGWRSQAWWGSELRGKTVGLVGLGATGYETATRIAPFCEELLVHDPYVSDDRVDEVGATRQPKSELVAESDIVSLHVRLTPDTRGLIGESEIAAMDDDALLVNTSRGAVVTESALADAVETGSIGGAVLDVFHEEPPSPDDPLIGHPDVLATPHLAGATTETRTRMLNVSARILVSVLNGNDVDEEYVANPEVL